MNIDSTPIDPEIHFRFYRCVQQPTEWVCKQTVYPLFVAEDEVTRLCAVNRLVPERFTRWMLQRQLPSHPVRVLPNSPGTW
jgi:hypothetical protein